MKVFEYTYCGESIIDAPEHIGECQFEGVPTDEYGIHKGTFKITIEWSEEEETDE